MMLKSLTIAGALLLSTSAVAAEYVAITPDRCATTRSGAVTAAQNDGYGIHSKSNAGFGMGSFVLCVRKDGLYRFWQFEPVNAKWCRTARRDVGTSLDPNGNCTSKF